MLPPKSLSFCLGTHNLLSYFFSYDHLSISHRCFATSLSAHSEPKSFAQTNFDSRCKKAMQAESTSHNHNKTWTLYPLPINNAYLLCDISPYINSTSKMPSRWFGWRSLHATFFWTSLIRGENGISTLKVVRQFKANITQLVLKVFNNHHKS
jgi:hypothetical protein